MTSMWLSSDSLSFTKKTDSGNRNYRSSCNCFRILRISWRHLCFVYQMPSICLLNINLSDVMGEKVNTIDKDTAFLLVNIYVIGYRS